jgi:glycosyltransferase involved in cell wall biosynthesis
MKIALVIASLGPGGAERVMSVLANYWAERGDDVTIITLQSREADVYVLDRRVRRAALGLVSDSAGMLRALANNWQRIRALRAAIRSTGARVVLSFEDRSNALVLIATLGLPLRCVVSERTDPTVHRIGPMWRIVRRLTYPLADALIVQTVKLLPWARRVMLGRARAHAIPNPLRPQHWSQDARLQRVARGHTIIALGRLGPEKGYDVLLRAFACIAPEFEDWTLSIVGEGPERESLSALAANLGLQHRLTMSGWTAEPDQVLAQAALFVSSSRYEGFPNALLEAMGAGLPVVSTACTGSAEIVADGINGVLVPVDDVQALACGMRRVMRDAALRRKLAENAVATAHRYHAAAIVPRWDTVLVRAPRCPIRAGTTAPSP